jgi:hypothetical protein
MAPAANAAVFNPDDNPKNFTVYGDINSSSVSANFGNSGIVKGLFTDTFNFIIDQTGSASGSLATSTNMLGSVTDLDIYSVVVNGISAVKSGDAKGQFEFFSVAGVPITFGAVNSIVVNGFSRGNGSYGGNATFTAAVPETTTWAIMLLGMGGIGATMRHRRRKTTVAYA